MHRLASKRIVSEWEKFIAPNNHESLETICGLVKQNSSDLANYFYGNMLNDEDASSFLSHDQVKARLSKSLQKWLINLYNITPAYDLTATLQQQVTVGEVHARIKIPIHLVLRGARCLKDRFASLLMQTQLEQKQLNACYQLYCDLIDIAMELMSQAYTLSSDQGSRSEEVYRLFSISQNLATERERQKAALLDWENKLMFEYTLGVESVPLPLLRLSDFGLWFHHKGAHAFHDYVETRTITTSIKFVDEELLPRFTQADITPEEKLQVLRSIRDTTHSIKFHLDDVFSRSSEMESGRDVLTRLLNRRFLPTVLSREISHARANSSTFAIVLLDVDYFKLINDTHGHDAGDAVLQQLSSVLINTCRSGDFVFRMGGEEFLLVLVDIELDAAKVVTEKIRKEIEKELFTLANNQKVNVTASLGLTMYEGHPDYDVLLQLADKALYDAKHAGRNRVAIRTRDEQRTA